MEKLTRRFTGWSHRFFILPLVVLLVSQAFGVHADERSPVHVVVSDILVMPGKPAMLKARIVQSGILRSIGVGGEEVQFEVEGKAVGTSLTGGDGWASWEFTPKMRGNKSVRAKVIPSSRVKGAEGIGILASWERRRPILLIDVTTLLQDAEGIGKFVSAMGLPVDPSLWPEPKDGASQELHKLAKFYYNVVYLFWNDGNDVEGVRAWLREHEFPSGLTRAIQRGSTPLKTFIDNLEEGGWDNLEAGIGRTPDFAKVLLKNRIKAIIFHKSENEEFPRRTKLVEDWKGVRRNL